MSDTLTQGNPGPWVSRLGFWSASLIATLFIVFTISFIAILLTSPLFVWSDLSGFVAFTQENSQIFQQVARFSMLLFGPLFVILLNSVLETTDRQKAILARISVGFGVAFAVCTGSHYFVQLSTVRLSLAKGELAALEQVVQANPYSAVSAINMLGWTLFLGLASLFIAPIFSGSGLERVIRYAFILNGIFCLLGGIGYLFEITVLVFLTINLGMGGAVLVAAISSAVFFRRMARETRPASDRETRDG